MHLPFPLCPVHDIVLLANRREQHTKIVLVRRHETLKTLNKELIIHNATA